MLVWPLTALLTWLFAWVAFTLLCIAGMAAPLAFVVALLIAGLLAWTGRTPWRRLFMVAGFPLSLLLSGAADGLPPWTWLLALVLLLVLYPLGTWGDAPLFPTPVQALRGLADAVPLNDGAVVIDAGCGLGAGLVALRAQFPHARLVGWEWSWPLAVLCAIRCRWVGGHVAVSRTDIWMADWSKGDFVYLFQRPESMPRAMEKAALELKPGAWLASLEFEALGYQPQARLETVPGKPLWLYRVPFKRR